MRTKFSTGLLLGSVAATSLVLAGCAAPADSPSADSDVLQVVASTNVYGDIASRVGGDLVEVTSIITGQTQDPHSYEASARDQLALAKADLVIENGGGYDPFIDTLLAGITTSDPVVVNASEASGLLEGDEAHSDEDAAGDEDAADDHAGEDADSHSTDDDGHAHVEGFNEHVWYSFHAMENVAEAIAAELGKLDPANEAVYAANVESFVGDLAVLEERAAELRASADGSGVAVTEPVPVYLLEEIGLVNLTPSAFSEAFEEGSDVPPAALQETLALFPAGSVSLLAYNEQTTGPESEQVRGAADDAGIAVVSFAETMPEDSDYIGWMTDNLESLSDALA